MYSRRAAELIACSSSYLYELIKRDTEYQSVVMEPTPEILSRLKLLSHIQKGEKLLVRNMSIQQDNWFTRIMRTWVAPDNRQNTLKLTKEIISRSFEILIHNIKSEKEADIFQCRMIIHDLIKAKDGLLNLKATYVDDIKFGCDIDILLQQIAARLSEIKKDHEALFTPDILEQSVEKKGDNTL